jgi:hypothetical protein
MSTPVQKQKDDPQETADYLLRKHGQHEAYAIALQGAADAQESGDNYSLSVWRDVKRLLKQGSSSSEVPATDTGQ